MVRAVLSIVGILAVVLIIMMCFGYTTPQVTTMMPGLNRSVAHTVDLMSGGSTGDDRGANAGSPGQLRSGPAGANSSPQGWSNPSFSPPGTGNAPAAARNSNDVPEIISPDSTAHWNPNHTHEVDQPGSDWASASGNGTQAFDPNPPAFVPPNPLPAHPGWTWDVGDREFKNVVVTRVDADMVTITADSGRAQIDIGLLPLETRQELNYDPTLAAQAAAERKAQTASVTANRP